jgi:hypothetical protein
MAGYNMNRYRGGSSTIVASRLGSAHEGAQLKVENPPPLRTIGNFDFRERVIAAGQRFLPGNLIKFELKIKKSASQSWWRHEHCTQNERPAWREGFHRRERRRGDYTYVVDFHIKA